MAKRLSPAALIALKEALAVVYWYKEDLKSFLLNCVGDRTLVTSRDWSKPKREVVAEFVAILAAKPELTADLTRVCLEVADFTDFTHLAQLDDGDDKVQKAKRTVSSLKKYTEGHTRVREDIEAAEKRRTQHAAAVKAKADFQSRLDELKRKLGQLVVAEDHQGKGYALERFLRELFDLFDLDAKASFKLTGEQIDGAFTFDSTNYLLEARWRSAQANAADLDVFAAKVTRKLDNTLGLFLSMCGYSADGISAHTRGTPKLILSDGSDLSAVVEGRIPLPELLRRKKRHASETGEIFLPAYRFLTLS
jgi:hypothetical protein